jgi:molybdopterin converting factor small subunit
MACKLRYFGMVADAVGKTEEWLEIPRLSNLGQLRAFLCDRNPALSKMAWNFALDAQIADDATTLQDQMEIVLLPPFAGG